jgi:hypothetical protein
LPYGKLITPIERGFRFLGGALLVFAHHKRLENVCYYEKEQWKSLREKEERILSGDRHFC